MGVTIDPLGDVTILWLSEHGKSLCNCPAKEMPAAKHWWNCSITPIFASMDLSELSELHNEFVRATLSGTQTVIKCAECGTKRRGKDLDVIYQASLNGPSKYKYPSNIVKAVCPQHNRVVVNGKSGAWWSRDR
jgi:hypothetical protein